MLRHFALMATDRRRNEDVLSRTSYKQFRMLLPGVDEEGAKVVVKKIRLSRQRIEGQIPNLGNHQARGGSASTADAARGRSRNLQNATTKR
jgi:GGDEF domain-containing protein